jgi:hypothetical protein
MYLLTTSRSSHNQTLLGMDRKWIAKQYEKDLLSPWSHCKELSCTNGTCHMIIGVETTNAMQLSKSKQDSPSE